MPWCACAPHIAIYGSNRAFGKLAHVHHIPNTDIRANTHHWAVTKLDHHDRINSHDHCKADMTKLGHNDLHGHMATTIKWPLGTYAHMIISMCMMTLVHMTVGSHEHINAHDHIESHDKHWFTWPHDYIHVHDDIGSHDIIGSHECVGSHDEHWFIWKNIIHMTTSIHMPTPIHMTTSIYMTTPIHMTTSIHMTTFSSHGHIDSHDHIASHDQWRVILGHMFILCHASRWNLKTRLNFTWLNWESRPGSHDRSWD